MSKMEVQAVIYSKQQKMFFVETKTASPGPFETINDLLKFVPEIGNDFKLTIVEYY